MTPAALCYKVEAAPPTPDLDTGKRAGAALVSRLESVRAALVAVAAGAPSDRVSRLLDAAVTAVNAALVAARADEASLGRLLSDALEAIAVAWEEEHAVRRFQTLHRWAHTTRKKKEEDPPSS